MYKNHTPNDIQIYTISDIPTTDGDYLFCMMRLRAIKDTTGGTENIVVTDNYLTNNLKIELVSGIDNHIKILATSTTESANSPCICAKKGLTYEFFPFVEGENVGEEFVVDMAEASTGTNYLRVTADGIIKASIYSSREGINECKLPYTATVNSEKIITAITPINEGE